jgi:hypothetical protein
MGTLLTARNLPGIGDAQPPEDEDLPECEPCGGMGSYWLPQEYGYRECEDCNGTGYRNDDRDGFDADDCPPYEGP